MQAPILSGVKVRDGAFIDSLPVNLEPRATDTGISKIQLVTSRGTAAFATGPGIDRGGIAWNGTLYRAMGSRLVSVSAAGAVTDIGEIGTDNMPAGFDYGFDRLAIRSAGKLFYCDGAALTQVTDVDLGEVRDVVWVDGYFMTTDGTSLVVTDLNDPASVDPLRYGSAESDPDAVTGLIALRDEVYALGRFTIEAFQNVGGSGFPFRVQKGATIPFGCVSATAKVVIGDTFAFVGGGKDEPIGVYVAGGGTARRISTPEVDELIAEETGTIEIEQRLIRGERQLIVHLSTCSLSFAVGASGEAEKAVWTVLQSGWFGPYRPRRAVLCYGRHIVGDTATSALAELTQATADHFGEKSAWQFDAGLMFNEGRGALLNEVELHGLFGVAATSIYLSATRDGVTWSNEVARRWTGQPGERLVWRPGLRVASALGMRFRGTERASVARCEVQAEGLAG